MRRFLWWWLALMMPGWAIEIVPSSYDASRSKVVFLDQRTIFFDMIDGINVSELSDVAYDKVRRRLYAVGDEGTLFVFNVRFGDTIGPIKPLRAAYLTKKNGKRFRRPARDSEGMTLDGKGRLYISFEGKPRVGRFCTKASCFGRLEKKIPIPRVLRDPQHYRSKNKALEALAWHPRYGLLTVPEWPLKRLHKKCHTVYALRGKRRWCFRAEPEPRSGVSAIEVMDDGNVLVLERSFRGFLEPLVVTLKKVYLNRCKKGVCESEVLVKMSTHKGWDIDNFEGLARVGKHRYVMVSDDNDNFFQKTLLVYFEVKP